MAKLKTLVMVSTALLVNVNYPVLNSFTPTIAANVTDIVLSVLSITEAQDRIVSLLQNQTKNQLTSQEKLWNCFTLTRTGCFNSFKINN